MTDPDRPGEEFSLVFDQSRGEQLSRLEEQVKRLMALPTTDEALDFALSEIEYTIHIIRERIWFDETNRNQTLPPPQPSNSSLEDII